jgi:UDP-glucose 4-epimerase
MITTHHKEKSNFLITGGAGFIGSHLCEALLSAGHCVTAFDNLSTGNVRNLKQCHKSSHFTFVEGDVLNATAVARAIQDADVVVHLAAALGVQRILQQPVQTLEVNVLGTHHILNAARENDCRVLIASTSEVYGKGVRVPFSEDDDLLLGATSKSRWGYATSKMLDEFMALAYHQEYQTDAVIFRLFNTVGPRQSNEYGMVLPRLVRQALLSEPLTIFGDGLQSRCFCHVTDVVRAILDLLLRPEASGQVFNIGNTEEVTILSLAEKIIQLCGSESQISYVPYSDAYPAGFEDMRRRVPNTQKIQALSGWQPCYSLTQIIDSVIEYERAMLSNEVVDQTA